MMRLRLLSLAIGAALVVTPAHATEQSLEDAADQISELFSEGFSISSENHVAARDVFLKAAAIAEAVLASHEGLDPATKRDMQYQAANGYYYAGEAGHELARRADDPQPFTDAKIVHFEKALAYQRIVFADGVDGKLVAEYFFGTSLLVEYGIETADPRTADWAEANVHSGRLRIDESKMMGGDDHYGAMNELVATLLDYAAVTGNAEARVEAEQLISQIPEDRHGSAIRNRSQR
mgnify:CR=1 FL=1